MCIYLYFSASQHTQIRINIRARLYSIRSNAYGRDHLIRSHCRLWLNSSGIVRLTDAFAKFLPRNACVHSRCIYIYRYLLIMIEFVICSDLEPAHNCIVFVWRVQRIYCWTNSALYVYRVTTCSEPSLA